MIKLIREIKTFFSYEISLKNIGRKFGCFLLSKKNSQIQVTYIRELYNIERTENT